MSQVCQCEGGPLSTAYFYAVSTLYLYTSMYFMQFVTFLHSLSYFLVFVLPLYGLWFFLAAADEEHLSTTMTKQQVKLFGRIAIANDTHPLRRLVFDSDHRFRKFSFNPRPVGRPKQCWVDEIYKMALSICGSEAHIARIFHHGVESLDNWHRLIDQHFRS